jgi:hypothetical protein
MVDQVQEAFGETMTSVVSLCARYPIACANSIGLLCTIPYTRQGGRETPPQQFNLYYCVVHQHARPTSG